MPLNIPFMVLVQANCGTALARRERDVHLIEAEEILLARRVGGYFLIAIEDFADKRKALGFRQMLRPFDKSHRAKSQKSSARLKIPSLDLAIRAPNLKTARLGQVYVLLDRQVEIRIMKGLEVADPARGKTGFFDGVFEAFSLTFRNQAQLYPAAWLYGGENGLERLGLLRDPVQRVE